MDKEEAKAVLEEELEKFKSCSYEDLKKYIGDPHCFEVTSKSGNYYQIELETVLDDQNKPEGDLQIIASIDDGGLLSAAFPITSGFIISPEK